MELNKYRGSTPNFYMFWDIDNILKNGYKDENPRPKYSDGTPAYTYSVNHVVRKYNLQEEFPINSLRRIAWKTAFRELDSIYIHPTNNILEMEKMGVGWWKPWDIGDGTIGQRYGATVRRYNLINKLLKDIKLDPYGRRKIVDLWQETDLRETEGLMPCAFCTIWNVRGEYLDMCLVQRSGDMLAASGAGCVNEVQYAMLQMMVAQSTGYKAGMFTHFVANEQIYDRHVDAANELMDRYVNGGSQHGVVKMALNPDVKDFHSFTVYDFTLVGYEPIEGKIELDLGI